ncbi:hypothetical protein [Limosilactobacillus fastidiosus]|nr:hypothetical protein [Limosilactobacillus fastidiosus]MCD7084878.1 hypothetical protein [Limosilactobacillus fastidiosus]MCD7085301.1 hypothetical protein [Limosilactobacillus fastidiosus]MCD7115144.1 hypothetical protein [Limosilactobacillus fastidiosus]MCD7116173.1 hypothetical protein [Limosilactobacillus fastidiosus]
MVKTVLFHGNRVSINKLANIYELPAKEINFRYQHGCREDNLVVKRICEESPYSFVKFKNKKITIKELLSKYPYLNVFIVRSRYNQKKNLITPP